MSNSTQETFVLEDDVRRRVALELGQLHCRLDAARGIADAGMCGNIEPEIAFESIEALTERVMQQLRRCCVALGGDFFADAAEEFERVGGSLDDETAEGGAP
ncbi:MAG: hypothetical protein JNM79_01700 [Burkholderiales bacterium]|nr:hypothetical protein [Burkholderiales bacterium]